MASANLERGACWLPLHDERQARGDHVPYGHENPLFPGRRWSNVWPLLCDVWLLAHDVRQLWYDGLHSLSYGEIGA
jgi:hypothetical protein